MFRYLLLALCALLLFGCEQKNDTQTLSDKTLKLQPTSFPEVTARSATLLKDSLETMLVETAAEAIPTWRKYAKVKPTLILLSQNPFLVPVPDQLAEETRKLIRNGSQSDIQKKVSRFTSNPTILPNMALSAALDSGLFGKVIWVIPELNHENPLDLKILKQQLKDQHLATATELANFSIDNTTIKGQLHNCLFEIQQLVNLNIQPTTSLLHIDLSFFKALYKNEFKTPLYSQLHDIMVRLQKQQLSTYATTVSLGTRTGNVDLRVRFLGKLLANFIRDPQSLESPLSKLDLLRKENMYIEKLFRKNKIQTNLLTMEELAPQNAAIQFELYLSSRRFNQGDRALQYLKNAVKLDHQYALEYLNLAPMAYSNKRPDEALRMLHLAQKTYPDDPFIQLRTAQLTTNLAREDLAAPLIEKLKQLKWSTVYYPQFPAEIDKIITESTASLTEKIPQQKREPTPD